MSDYWKAESEKHWEKTKDLNREIGGLSYELKAEKEKSSNLSDEISILRAEKQELEAVLEAVTGI